MTGHDAMVRALQTTDVPEPPPHPAEVATQLTPSAVELPAPVRLDRFLEQPDPEVTYRIDQLWPADGRVVLAAQFKSGKTTTVGNLLRSLVDGEPFLGRYTVAPPPGRVVLIDDELHENTLRRWLRDQQIVNTAAVDILTMRGRLATFDLLNDQVRTAWAGLLRQQGASVVILDCLQPLIDALGLSEDKDTGRVLEALDALCTAADVTEAVVVHHMGHSGERSRGDSRLRDWPDAEWRLVRDGEAPASPRYFAAYGRDVDVAEKRLELTDGRRLTIVGGSRIDAAAESALEDLLAHLAGVTEPQSGRQLEEALTSSRGNTRGAVRGATTLAIERGLVVTERGPRNAILHRAAEPPSAPVRGSAPTARQLTADECASAPIGGRTAQSPAHWPSEPPGEVDNQPDPETAP